MIPQSLTAPLPARPEPAPADAPPAGPPQPTLLRRLLPILVLQVYLNLSLATFAFGPWVWPVPDGSDLYLYVLVAHLALLLGYLSGAFGAPRGYHAAPSADTLLRVSLGLTIVLFLPTLLWLTGGVVDLVGAIRDPATAYYRFQAVAESSGGTTLISYVRTLTAPILALAIPLLAMRWRHSPVPVRILGVVGVLLNLSIFVFTGRNKGLIDLIMLAPWLFLLAAPPRRRRANPVRVIGAVVALALMVGVFSDYYMRNHLGRTGVQSLENPYWVRVFGGMEADADNWMVRGLPVEQQAMVLGLTFNQTHGYYALALALEKPFEPTWGLGHSYFLQTMQVRFLGSNSARAHSYPGRLESENGWSITEWWHTIYPWLASDVTFPGAIVVVFLLGRIFALTWVDALRGANPYAVGLVVLMFTLVYYFPTNNIVLGQPEAFASFWGLLLLWLGTRQRVRIAHAPGVPGAVATRPGAA